MTALAWLAAWCVTGGGVGALIGVHTGRVRTGLLLGTFCGLFGWVLLLGAPPRARVAVVEPAPPIVAPDAPISEAPLHDPVPVSPPLSWAMPGQRTPLAAH